MSAVAACQKVLVVDDEEHIVELARLYLSREGYQVEGVADGVQALNRFGQLKPDLVVLDIMLPGMDGLTICREIRKTSQVPIIMLTARDEITDKVVGLELGADDYLTKPFHPQELVARAKALLRRARLEPDQPRLIRAGRLEVDLERHEVRQGSTRIQLRPKEFDELALQVVSERQLVVRQECATPAAACGLKLLASQGEYESRLRSLAEALPGDRLLLMNRQGYIVFDSQSSEDGNRIRLVGVRIV